MLYTFLPIAPCTFFLSGKRFDIKVNEPFSVNLKEAKIISSPTFAYRKYVRLVTPLPEEKPPEPVIVKPTIQKVESKVDVQVQPEVNLKVEPEVEVQEETPKRRSRKKSNVEES